MLNIIKKVFRKIKEKYYIFVYPLLLREDDKKVECPFCGWRGAEFFSAGIKLRRNARCPKCGSLERNRLYYLYLKRSVPKEKPLRLLHFAPERILTGLFKSFSNIEYLSADINKDVAMLKEDITNISFEDNSFDVIFCSHVLEHIEDDKKAMKELRRVLKPEGFAIIQVPIKDIDRTFEDFSIKDPAEREKIFGQKDHVRNYGRDYVDRLKESGFNVKVDRFAYSLSVDIINTFAISKESIYYCTK